MSERNVLSSRERVHRAARGLEVDRIPTLAGWIGGASVLASLARISVEQYVADPLAGAVAATARLGADAVVDPVYPTRVDQVRTAALLEENFLHGEPEDLVRYADTLPDSDAGSLQQFDEAKVTAQLRQRLETLQRDWGRFVLMPNLWHLGGHFPLYHQFGYVPFLSACAEYPQAVTRIWRHRSLHSRQEAKILVRLMSQFDLPPLFFCGEDLCNNQGPMVSPDFLRQHYLPTVKLCIEPLVDAGVRVIHHCDGDVRPLIDDFLAIGFSGLQGFQFELGINPFDLASKRDALGRPLLYFASMNVTRTLPFGTPDDVRAEVDWLYDWTDSGRQMFLFTGNVTGAEVPAENLLAGYAHAQALKPGGPPRGSKPRPWPHHEKDFTAAAFAPAAQR